ncbi:MAG TPA: PstS family phosphate ABC transporter substrate-binding protein, partial [Candidatus Dojkabacteria bacterium]
EEFLIENQDTQVSVTGGGSGVGIASLINGEIDLANSSREMKDAEKEQVESDGTQLYEFIFARDKLGVIVHKENPLTRITKENLSKIYKGEITNWSEIGGEDQKIVLYGRQTTSGTYEYFRSTAVEADYSPSMLNMEGTQAILDAVISDKNGIGYVGAGYLKDENGDINDNVVVLELSEDGENFISPFSGEDGYLLDRPLYQYFTSVSNIQAIKSFLEFEISDNGKEVVERNGFFPIQNSDSTKNQEVLNNL